jgi:hypothetical protein
MVESEAQQLMNALKLSEQKNRSHQCLYDSYISKQSYTSEDKLVHVIPGIRYMSC